MIHPARLPVDELQRQCTRATSRRRGPGGQHRNKTESAVVLRHDPTGVEGQAAERRSQVDNHRNALKRLRVNLALEVRVAQSIYIAPTELWRQRCPHGRIAVNPDHDDFAALLSEALDVIAARHGNLHSTAEQLSCTFSQLLKFLKQEPRAWQLVVRWRAAHGLSELE